MKVTLRDFFEFKLKMQTCKVVVVGNSGSLKTPLIKSIVYGEECCKYPPTLGVEVNVYTTHETIFNIWDCAGIKKFEGLGKAYYSEAQLALVVEGGEETRSLSDYEASIREVAGDIPIYRVSGSFEEKKERILAIFASYPNHYSTPSYD